MYAENHEVAKPEVPRSAYERVRTALSNNAAATTRQMVIWYRRSSTRALGLVLNPLEGLLRKVPGRA